MNICEETQNAEDPSKHSVHNQEVERKEAEKSNKSRLDEDDNLSDEPFGVELSRKEAGQEPRRKYRWGRCHQGGKDHGPRLYI